MLKQSRRSSTDAAEPPARPAGAAATWGPVSLCLLLLREKQQAARWPPNRCSANICARPAERVGKMAEWVLFLHTNTRARFQLLILMHTPVSVFLEDSSNVLLLLISTRCLFWSPSLQF